MKTERMLWILEQGQGESKTMPAVTEQETEQQLTGSRERNSGKWERERCVSDWSLELPEWTPFSTLVPVHQLARHPLFSGGKLSGSAMRGAKLRRSSALRWIQCPWWIDWHQHQSITIFGMHENNLEDL